MSEQHEVHPDSGRIEPVPEGDAVVVFTPCDGAPVLVPLDQAVPGAKLDLVCPRDGRAWRLELATDHQAAPGMRPVWVDVESLR